ncbi:MAG: hypothetical protein P4L86_21685, partial [Mycobacterium sp.]|nr:hypothetical protein [Mycobacterium sp.]
MKKNADGDWATAANWAPGTPDSTSDVQIVTANPHTITHSTGADTILSLNVNTCTLAMTGGSLRVIGNTTSYATITDTGTATLTFGGFNSTIYGSVIQTAGTIAVASGWLHLSGAANNFAGTLSGTGVEFAGTATTLAAGMTRNVTQVLLSAGSLALGQNYTQSGTWSQTGGTLALGGKVLTLSGGANFDGGVINGAGTVAVTGSSEISLLFVEGSAVLKNSGRMTQTSSWYLGYNGTDTPQFNNVAGGVLVIGGNANIYGTTGAALTNAGLISKIDGGTTQIYVLTTSTGSIGVNAGTLNFAGTTNSFGGVIGGGGTIALVARADTFLAGLSMSLKAAALAGANLTLGGGLTYGGSWTETSGTLALGGNAFTLSGLANFDGGVVNGAGTLSVTGTGEISSLFLEGTALLKNAGKITMSGSWYDGYNGTDTPQVSNLAGATFTIANNTYLYGSAGASLTNAGTLVKLGGGLSQISVATTNTGSITIASGVLRFAGGTNNFGGTVTGAGTLELYAGTDSFSSGVTLGTGTVLMSGANLTLGANLTYAGIWTGTGGTLALAGKVLTLSGSTNLDGLVVNGAGTLALSSNDMISGLAMEGSTVLRNSGNLTQTSGWYLGYIGIDTAQLNNLAGATFTIANNTNINSVAGASLINAGSLVKTGGGLSTIYASTTSTGSVTIASGVLSFNGTSNSFGGSVAGAGTLQLASGADSFQAALGLTVAAATLSGAN